MTLTPELLLSAYRIGVFPMADPDGEIGWYAPDPRAILPLDRFHVSKTLAKTVRQGRFEVAVDRDFEGTMRACAAPAPGREETWISEALVAAYVALHRAGYAHSVECWRDGAFAGGLYGVALGGVFFGESMVSHERDASKVALVALVERLRAGGFQLLDIQMTSAHLARFGAVEITRAKFERRLADALAADADWRAIDRRAADERAALPPFANRTASLPLDHEAERATAVLSGKAVRRVYRHRASEVLVEFEDGTRLFVEGESGGPVELSVTDGSDPESRRPS